MEERTKWKVTALTCVVMYAICLVSVYLFIPRIITSIVDEEEVTSRASTLKSFSDAANALVAIFCVPILGSMSDVFGRKKIMLLGSIAEMFYLTCLLGAYAFKWLWMVFFYTGMAVHLGAIAYMSDISIDEKEKAKNFGQVMASFMGGLIIGSVLLGVLGQKNLELSLFFLLCWSLVLVLFIIFAFKDTPTFFEDPNREKVFKIKSGNPFQAMKLIFATSPYIALLGFIYALNFLSLYDVMSSGYLYGWGSLGNGITSALRGLAGVLWQTIGVALLLKVVPRHYILSAAMFAAAAIHATQGAAPFGWVFFTAAVIGGFAAISFPLIQSLVSDAIPKEKQGIALGGLSSVMSISMLIGALVSENLFALCLLKNYVTCPGTAFYVSALTLVIAGFICLFLFKRYPPLPPPFELVSSSSTSSLSSDTHNDQKELLSSIHVPDERGSAQL